MFWKKEILHDWMETPDSIAICFHAGAGVDYPCVPSHANVTPVAQPSFTWSLLQLQKALVINHNRLFWLRWDKEFLLQQHTLHFIVPFPIWRQCRALNNTTVTHMGPAVIITSATCLQSRTRFETHFCANSADWEGASDCCTCEVDDER